MAAAAAAFTVGAGPSRALGQGTDISIDRFGLDEPPALHEELPPELLEISGLAFSGEGRLFAHQDERGFVYELDPRSGQALLRFRLGSSGIRGDFEGIAIAGYRFFLVESDGSLVEFGVGGADERVEYRRVRTGFGNRCEVEGLAFDAATNALLMVCKTSRRPDLEGHLVVFAFSLDEMALESDAAPVEAPSSTESESATPEFESSPPESESPAEPAQAKSKKEKKEKGPAAGRGVETMFRTAYRTHLELSTLADTKANIMISINGIIISIIVATVSSTVADNASLLLPAAVLLLTCMGSLVFAILAARPRISSEVVDPEEVRSGKRNILFFGNFVHMPEDEFVEGIQDLMRRKDDLYDTMSRDLYSLGSVLARKYQLIRTAYNIFMVGLTVGVTLFVIVLVMGAVVPPPPFTP